jgi:hypothetical protein
MTSSRRVLVLSLAAALAALGAGADAGERVHKTAVLQPAPAGRLRRARIDVVRRSLQDQVIRLRARGGVRGEPLGVFIADDGGVMTLVGLAEYRRRLLGVEWKVRTARGDALPFGVPDVAFLSGRPLQLRTQAGQVVLSGVVPAAKKATGIPLRTKHLRQSLDVDEAVAGAGAEAHVVVLRHDDTTSLKIDFEGPTSGLALEAWVVREDASEEKLGDLVEETPSTCHGDDGDDEDDDEHDDKAAALDDDDDDADAAPESRYELVVDEDSTLPFGFTSLEELAGLRIEIRNAADDSVLAGGFLPDVSAPDAAADDDDQGDDNDEQGDDDQGEDEDE